MNVHQHGLTRYANEHMKNNKNKNIKWVQEREHLNRTIREEVEIIGKMGADGVVDGKLPNGTKYQWEKIRNGHL